MTDILALSQIEDKMYLSITVQFFILFYVICMLKYVNMFLILARIYVKIL